ncbi:12656_t:CDS:2 [Funneliformis caledonium]|uniref:12656_t:CDS:1 n=1 Tax=Funneliformis caledonium TaxID=1117310 RepID=A0A9N8VBU4_9GLOM|nr:12656_t:CDS:2 [Funneliformis caledonium]
MYLTKKLGKKSKGSDKTYYAAVEEPCTNYIVQFGAPHDIFSSTCKILKAKLFVDGQWDHTCMQLQQSRVKASKDGFFDEQRYKNLFKFDVTNWIDDDSRGDAQFAKSKFGGIGAISVYFYKAKGLEKVERIISNNKDRIQKVQVLESTGIGMGIKLSTGFEKSQNVKVASNKMLSSLSTIPVAALHIHYRPESWLRARSILFDDIQIKSEIGIGDEFKNIKNESVIKQEYEEIKSKDNNEGCKILVKREFASIEERKQEYDGIKSDIIKKRFKEDAKPEKDYLRNELKQYKTLSVAKHDIDVILLKQRRLERENGVKNHTLLKLKR